MDSKDNEQDTQLEVRLFDMLGQATMFVSLMHRAWRNMHLPIEMAPPPGSTGVGMTGHAGHVSAFVDQRVHVCPMNAVVLQRSVIPWLAVCDFYMAFRRKKPVNGKPSGPFRPAELNQLLVTLLAKGAMVLQGPKGSNTETDTWGLPMLKLPESQWPPAEGIYFRQSDYFSVELRSAFSQSHIKGQSYISGIVLESINGNVPFYCTEEDQVRQQIQANNDGSVDGTVTGSDKNYATGNTVGKLMRDYIMNVPHNPKSKEDPITDKVCAAGAAGLDSFIIRNMVKAGITDAGNRRLNSVLDNFMRLHVATTLHTNTRTLVPFAAVADCLFNMLQNDTSGPLAGLFKSKTADEANRHSNVYIALVSTMRDHGVGFLGGNVDGLDSWGLPRNTHTFPLWHDVTFADDLYQLDDSKFAREMARQRDGQSFCVGITLQCANSNTRTPYYLGKGERVVKTATENYLSGATKQSTCTGSKLMHYITDIKSKKPSSEPRRHG
jgi:hypothetical protein